jgi:hypothetical protein
MINFLNGYIPVSLLPHRAIICLFHTLEGFKTLQGFFTQKDFNKNVCFL